MEKEIRTNQILLDDVVNMDEVPMTFDIAPTRSVAPTGVKAVAVTAIGHKRNNFTVVLACTGNGAKLKTMIIFKRVTMPREKLSNGVVVCVNRKGWMN